MSWKNAKFRDFHGQNVLNFLFYGTPSFCNTLKKVRPPCPHHHYNHTKMPKNPKIISVNLALDLIKETSFFNKRCTNPWKFCEVKKNSHKNNGVLTPQTKITSLKLLKYPHKLDEFLILLNSVGGMGARVRG